MDVYFKLFHSIKQQDEIELASLEIESLANCPGKLERIHSVADLLQDNEFRAFINTLPIGIPGAGEERLTFQRYLEYQASYNVHGFLLRNAGFESVSHLTNRLAYTRELYCVLDERSLKTAQRKIFPHGEFGTNLIGFQSNNSLCLRIITNQYYLEGTEYISKISSGLRNRKALAPFLDRLKSNLVYGINRIPASNKARVGKRFLDYLAERQEASRHLFHGLHPYKGKFHPKLARVLLNIAYPGMNGLVMDNYAGSGTLPLEAALMGLDFIGTDINPLSVLLCRARTFCLDIDIASLDRARKRIKKLVESEYDRINAKRSGIESLTDRHHFPTEDRIRKVKEMSETTYSIFTGNGSLNDILLLQSIISTRFRAPVKEVLMLGLAMVISKGKRLKKLNALNEFESVLEDIARRMYLFQELKEVLNLQIGQGEVRQINTDNLSSLKIHGQIDAIVNSPPYSTAIDYVKNDLDQLILLKLVRSKAELEELDSQMGGNPRFLGDKKSTLADIGENAHNLPQYGIDVVRIMISSGRKKQGCRLYHFYKLLNQALAQERLVLKPGAKAITVIGNNLLKLTHPPRIDDSQIHFQETSRHIAHIRRENNVKSIHTIVVEEHDIGFFYGDSVPIGISQMNNSDQETRNGVYLDIENDRVLGRIALDHGFKLKAIIFRYLEKTRRGDIRLEAILVRVKNDEKNAD